MQGYLLKRSGFFGSWQSRYVALLQDRVEVRAEQRVGQRLGVIVPPSLLSLFISPVTAYNDILSP